MDTVTYALLKKKITSALTGIANIALVGTDKIEFTTTDGTTFQVQIPGPDLVYIGNTEPPVGSNYELWIDTSVTGVSGGGSALSSSLTATTVIGSVTNGKSYAAGTSLEDIVRDILVSETAPIGVLTHIPADKFYDIITDTVSSIQMNLVATKKTNKIATIEFYVNDAVVKTLNTPVDVENGGTFDYTHTFTTPTNSNIKLKAVITDVNGLKANPNTVIKFVGRSYYGVVAETVVTPTESDIKGLSDSTLKDTSSLTYKNIAIPQDGNLYKVLYAYPKEFGAINKIVDADGRDYTGSYTRTELQVDGIDYYSYILTNGTGATGATQKFS